MKRIRRFLAILLVATIVSSMPVSALDTTQVNPLSTSPSTTQEFTNQVTEDTAQVFEEDLTLRTANIKQFKNGNSYVAAIYADSVHYKTL